MRRAMSPAIWAKRTLVRVAGDGDGVALVLRAGHFAARDQELALGVFDVRDLAGDGRAVDVHVENVQENADARAFGALAVADDADHFAVGRRNRDGAVGDGAIGVTEEVEAEESEQEQGRGEGRVGASTRAARPRRRGRARNRCRPLPFANPIVAAEDGNSASKCLRFDVRHKWDSVGVKVIEVIRAGSIRFGGPPSGGSGIEAFFGPGSRGDERGCL